MVQQSRQIGSSTFRGEQLTRHEADGLGRIIRTKMTYTDDGVEKEAITEYYYDENGNLVKMIDANNTPLPPAEQKAFVYTYSATDLVLSETDPAGNSTTYTYDRAGNRTSMTDPRGGRYEGDFTIIYEYDDLNRLVAGYLPMSPGETENPWYAWSTMPGEPARKGSNRRPDQVRIPRGTG